MNDPTPIQPLGYFRPHKPKFVEDAEARGWRYRRIVFRCGLIALFLLIAFYFGPNLVNFKQLTRPTPDYFIPGVVQTCVPVVRAMKEYRRDYGHLPSRKEELAPRYLSEIPPFAFVSSGHFDSMVGWNEVVGYDFTPGNEHWSISGPIANGRLSLPAVTIDPAHPGTQP